MIHIHSKDCTLVVEAEKGLAPRLWYFGKKLPTSVNIDAIKLALMPFKPHVGLNENLGPSLIPTLASGFFCQPALKGHSQSQRWAPEFVCEATTLEPQSINIRCISRDASLAITIVLTLDYDSNVFGVRYTLTQLSSTPYALEQLYVAMPLPLWSREVMSFTGRWCQELRAQRQTIAFGTLAYENYKGRTSHDHFPGLLIGEPHFSEGAGSVLAAHLAWSGNHSLRIERTQNGHSYLFAGNQLLPGEVVLSKDQSYSTPWLYCAFSDSGLSDISQQYHQFVRNHIVSFPMAKPRPVLLNTWEAVYFDHDLEGLKALAKSASTLGVERFVLDDGWFKGRNHASAGLGDWYVDEHKYPNGLHPLIDYVKGLNMEFGLWVEPEMVNPDSDLFRAHPDWILSIEAHTLQPQGRDQYVLDLSNPDVYHYLLQRLTALLDEYDIQYFKWDMNRDLLQAGNRHFHPAVTAQTRAVYALMDDIKKGYPHVEIESCSSGGGRIDYEVLKRCQRFWPSDCNDAIERLYTHYNLSLFLPPEVLGMHIGPEHVHTTRRHQNLLFRFITAFFGHLGLEVSPVNFAQEDIRQLSELIRLHKLHRSWMHSGDFVRLSVNDPNAVAIGCISAEQHNAIFSYAQLAMPEQAVPEPLRLRGLNAEADYSVRVLLSSDLEQKQAHQPPDWGEQSPLWFDEPLVLSGAQLMNHGLSLPAMDPENALLFELRAASTPV